MQRESVSQDNNVFVRAVPIDHNDRITQKHEFTDTLHNILFTGFVLLIPYKENVSKDFTLFVVDVGTGNACLYTGFLAYNSFTVPFLVKLL